MGLLIVQPPGGGLRSGGYAYNEEIGRCLEARELGGLCEVARSALPREPFPTGSHLLIDSLFLDQPVSEIEARELRAKQVQYYLLLHLLPFDDPTADPANRSQIRAAIESWLPLLSGIAVTGQGAANEWCHHFTETFEPIIAQPAIRGTTRAPRSGKPPRRLLTVGGLCPRKNQRAILETLKKASDPTWHWDIVGHVDHECAYTRAFINEVESQKWGDRVQLHGSISQEACDQLFSKADLFVSASRFESFGMAAATALASRIPTLSYRVGDIEQWCDSGEGCWLFPPDDQDGFASQLFDLLHRDGCLPIPKGVRIPCASWEDTLSRLLAILA